MTNEAAPSGAKSASNMENDVSAEKETSGAVDPTWCGPMPFDPAARVQPTPEEIEAIGRLTKAYGDLQRLGWSAANYAPSRANLHVIEVGSSGIHKGYRDEARRFWVYDGDEWPSQPCLYRLDRTPPHQEHANPSSSLAEPLQGAHAPPIDPAPSPGVQTISGACHNGGSSPSALHGNSDTTTNTGE